MRGRLALLDKHGLKLSEIQKVIGMLHPLDGAKEFLDELRSLVQVVILSDTFEQFATPLLRQLGWPVLLCHRLVVENDRIMNYQLRIREQKREAVAAFKRLNYHVIAAGDSFNDTAMLKERTLAFFARAGRGKKAIPAIQSRGDLRRFDEADQKRDGVTFGGGAPRRPNSFRKLGAGGIRPSEKSVLRLKRAEIKSRTACFGSLPS